MSYFARKIDYCANETSFVALIKIVRKKGGKPIKFILYRYAMNYGAEMIEFGDDEKEAKKSFPYGPVVFENTEDNRELKRLGLPRRKKEVWQKTTEWLYKVAVGGGYAIHSDGDWIKVGRSAIWNRHRRKMRLRFGELGHLSIISRKKLEISRKELDEKLEEIYFMKFDYVGEDEVCEEKSLSLSEIEKLTQLEKEVNEIEQEIEKETSQHLALFSEMKIVSKKR